MSKAVKQGRPHWLIVGMALAVTLGAGAAGEYGLTARASLKASAAGAAAPGSTTAHPSTPAAGTHPMKFGLDYGSTLMSENSGQIRTGLQDAVRVGAKWIRIDLPWADVQPVKAAGYTWGRFDTVAGIARSLGLHIDAVLDGTPSWAATPACRKATNDPEFCPPSSNSDFALFASAAVHRYGNAGVDAWEIWNEPNIAQRWWPSANAAAYAQLLGTVGGAVRAADHKAFILLGGLAAVPDSPAVGYVSQNTFLDKLVAISGSLANVNAISYHPFSAPTMPSLGEYFQDINSVPGNLQGILQRSGNPNIQIWITESGSTEFFGAIEPIGTPVTAAQLRGQAQYATDLVKTVSTNPAVSADFWFSDQDIPAEGSYWGLRDAAGKDRPVLASLKAAITACGCSTN